jgi:hypothetical protein
VKTEREFSTFDEPEDMRPTNPDLFWQGDALGLYLVDRHPTTYPESGERMSKPDQEENDLDRDATTEEVGDPDTMDHDPLDVPPVRSPGLTRMSGSCPNVVHDSERGGALPATNGFVNGQRAKTFKGMDSIGGDQTY